MKEFEDFLKKEKMNGPFCSSYEEGWTDGARQGWKAALEWVLQEAEEGNMINEFNQPLYLLLIQEELEK